MRYAIRNPTTGQFWKATLLGFDKNTGWTDQKPEVKANVFNDLSKQCPDVFITRWEWFAENAISILHDMNIPAELYTIRIL